MRNTYAQVSYNLNYELQEARIAAGVSLAEFAAMPGIPYWLTEEQQMCRADLLVWYRYRQYQEAVLSNLQAAELERRRGK